MRYDRILFALVALTIITGVYGIVLFLTGIAKDTYFLMAGVEGALLILIIIVGYKWSETE